MSTSPRQCKDDTQELLACLGKAMSAPIGLKLPQRNRSEQASRTELGALDGPARSQNPKTEVKS